MTTQIQLRRGTAADWTSANPILAEGELGAELDTGKFKIGNGINTWSTLVYASGPAGADGLDGEVTLNTAQTLTNKTLTGYTETVYSLDYDAISEANGSIQTKTLAANTTFTESLTSGQSVILGVTSGSYTITWPSGILWTKIGGSGAAPTLTNTGINWAVLWKVEGVLRGSFLGTA